MEVPAGIKTALFLSLGLASALKDGELAPQIAYSSPIF